jgi:hypothetical protein
MHNGGSNPSGCSTPCVATMTLLAALLVCSCIRRLPLGPRNTTDQRLLETFAGECKYQDDVRTADTRLPYPAAMATDASTTVYVAASLLSAQVLCLLFLPACIPF